MFLHILVRGVIVRKIEQHAWPPEQLLAAPSGGTVPHAQPSADAQRYSSTCWEAGVIVLSRFLIDYFDAIAEGHALSQICAVRVHHRTCARTFHQEDMV